MYRDIDVNEAIDSMAHLPLIDLRSPGEYLEATMPGATNIPLLDNIERSLVGKTYKQQGSNNAREMAMEILALRLPTFIKSCQKKTPGKEVVVFCWRGGERSRFAGSVLDAMGFRVHRINGGFKAYRRYVVEYFNREVLDSRAVVLHGLTGVGKTDILLELKQLGMPIIDLEGLANHRGSVFGRIGQNGSPTQKMFESLIEHELRQVKGDFFLVECESRKIGMLFIPNSVINTMKAGCRILLYSTVSSRIERIKRDYFTGEERNLEALQEAITRLTKYLGKDKVNELNQMLFNGNVTDVIEYLLVKYYDPLYKYPDGPSDLYDLSVNTENINSAVQKIKNYLDAIRL